MKCSAVLNMRFYLLVHDVTFDSYGRKYYIILYYIVQNKIVLLHFLVWKG